MLSSKTASNKETTPMPWILDPLHTHIGFSAKHMMVSTVRGQFKQYSGTLTLDKDDFTRTSVEGEIEVASIDTANADRDTHLRNNDFFDAPNHPKITYKSSRIERKDDDTYLVYGDLTIRGITKEVVLEAEYNGIAKNPYGQTITGVSAKGTINRKDFGVSFNALLETGGVAVSEKIKIEIEAEAVWQEETAEA
jgi:polyisoprenoid-binding protein YceI